MNWEDVVEILVLGFLCLHGRGMLQDLVDHSLRSQVYDPESVSMYICRQLICFYLGPTVCI